MIYDEFFKIVDVKKEDVEDAKNFLKLRGVKANIKVANFLQEFSNKKITYEEVATAFRYDKRIRRILYKYLGVIEEISRSNISNEYPKIKDLPEFAYEKLKKFKKIEKISKDDDTYDIILKLLFSTTIKLADFIFNYEKVYNGNIDFINPRKEVKDLIELRNLIGHNKFLFTTKSNSVNGMNSIEKIKKSIINLSKFLPSEIYDNFIKEINEAKIDKGNSYSFQKEWNLIPEIMINLKSNL